MSSLRALLAQLSPDPHKKGAEFELLVKWFLENEPEYKALIKKVYRWNSSPHRWGRDTGIDLTAEGHDGTLWAIQAKAYDANYYVTKSDVDKFLSESGRQPHNRKPFEVRLLVATTDCLGTNARNVLQETPGARRLLLADLEKSPLTWPCSFADLKPAKIKLAEARQHQKEAIRDVVKGFQTASRGQLLMACGTGKTLTALWIAEALKAQRVLVLLPSLSLVRQTLCSWYAHGSRTPPYQVVCSDVSVRKGEDGDELVSTTSELPYPVTTNSREVAAFMRGNGHRYVFSTYHSSPAIAGAFASDRRLAPFDLIVADEAHRVAGAVEAAFATVLDATSIKAKRRLFMTATPRYATGRLMTAARDAGVEVASMDDETRFGRVLHKLTFAEAIRRQLLTDYQVAVVVVDDEQHRETAERGAFARLNGQHVDARRVACQLGLACAMRNFNLRKVVSFHSRVKWAATFADSFPTTVALMPRATRPDGELWCRHVSGSQSTRDRDTDLTMLRELGTEARGLIANSRCLTEGIDVPSLDGIAFIDPRQSEVDVVQAVGRAIRNADDKRIGTIVIPVFVGKRADAIKSIETSAFKPVWQVLQALRAHDDMLASELDELLREKGRRGTTGRLPAKIKVIGAREIGAKFVAAFDARLVEEAAESWQFWFGVLEEFVGHHGHASPTAGHVTAAGLRLGVWVGNQRANARRGTLSSDRLQQLGRLRGWSWNTRDDAWNDGFRRLEEFVTREGHANVPGAFRTRDGFSLGKWVNKQRTRRRQLAADRIERLTELNGWTWDARESSWSDAFGHLLEFVRCEGHAAVPDSYVASDGFNLGAWVVTQRTAANKNQLPRERALQLESVDGWIWAARENAWDGGYFQLVAFVEREGHATVPTSHVTESGFQLGVWANTQRTKAKRDRLPPDLAQRLSKLKGWVWAAHDHAWEEGLRYLEKYVKREGHARVAPAHVAADGFQLGRWVNRQRAAQKGGQLSRGRVAQLSKLEGWTAVPYEVAWESGLRHLEAFVASEGHANVPQQYITADGFGLGAWVCLQRLRARKGRLAAERGRRLARIRSWSWDPLKDQWNEALGHLQDFIGQVGHCRVPDAYVTADGFKLGNWVTNRRTRAKRGILEPEQVTLLTKLPGWSWNSRDDAWNEGFGHLEVFVDREGHARVPASYVTAYGFPLGRWVNKQRAKAKTLAPERAKRLSMVKGWKWNART